MSQYSGCLPSGENTATRTISVCPSKQWTSFWSLTSHSRDLPSSSPRSELLAVRRKCDTFGALKFVTTPKCPSTRPYRGSRAEDRTVRTRSRTTCQPFGETATPHDGFGVSLELRQLFAGGGVPDMAHFVLTASQQFRPVWADRRPVDQHARMLGLPMDFACQSRCPSSGHCHRCRP